jgi:hypothetical protein
MVREGSAIDGLVESDMFSRNKVKVRRFEAPPFIRLTCF